jgi:hypothetical protein
MSAECRNALTVYNDFSRREGAAEVRTYAEGKQQERRTENLRQLAASGKLALGQAPCGDCSQMPDLKYFRRYCNNFGGPT